jgi:hypothetical protein
MVDVYMYVLRGITGSGIHLGNDNTGGIQHTYEHTHKHTHTLKSYLDVDVLRGVIGRSVHLSNDNAGDFLELLSELVPDRSKLLAVSAPRGVELDQNVLVFLVDDFVEVGAHLYVCMYVCMYAGRRTRPKRPCRPG